MVNFLPKLGTAPRLILFAVSIMLDHLTTEASNPASEDLDEMSTLELVSLINAQDAGVALAVGLQAEQIAMAIDAISNGLLQKHSKKNTFVKHSIST